MVIRQFVIGLLVLMLLPAGCSETKPPHGQVHGQVTLDGQPLSVGQVEFFSTTLGVGAQALITEDGSYVVKDPLQVGEYAVMVRDLVPEPGKPAPKTAQIPAKYSDAGTSGLKHKIISGSNEFNIPLLSK